MNIEELKTNQMEAKLSFFEDCLKDITLTIRMDCRMITLEEEDGTEKNCLALGWFVDPRVSGRVPPLSVLSGAVEDILTKALTEYLLEVSDEEEEEEEEE